MTAPGIAITRVFDAPRERVWREWTEPERFADWYGGPDAEVPLATVTMDVRPGGRWSLTMLFGSHEIRWAGEYREVVPPERLVFTVTDRPGEVARELVIVDLVDLGDGRTEMRFQQRGGGLDADGYERAKSGWGTFFKSIDERLVTPEGTSGR
ncbi:MAG TPA: SRPBCC domain-containing protein [Solirubrobacteraceae bacterium]|nr:SRPBCC domain-containing protein [Solirubrobacteraceae bacterium]